jgi:hypothetical protein
LLIPSLLNIGSYSFLIKKGLGPFLLLLLSTPTEKKNETNILKKIKITKFFGDVNAPLQALYYLTITTFYGCNG